MKTKLCFSRHGSYLALTLVVLSIVNTRSSKLFAQNSVFTYQGRVTDGGTNFTGVGQFEFALVTSSNANHTATATANAPSGGFITGYNVGGGGNGYVTAPAVTIFGGGGSGAAAHANISGGAVISLSVDNPGNGHYTNAPTVLIAPPPPNFSYVTFWSNDGTSVNGSEPSAAVGVAVSGGLFTVALGDTTVPDMVAISSSLFAQANLQLRIWFNDGANGFAALDPPQPLTPAPYALNVSGGLSIQQNSYGAPNVIGGSSVNYVSNGVVGATIGGGGSVSNQINNTFFGVITNSVLADFGTLSGGLGNTVTGLAAIVGGGYNNAAENNGDTVAGGWFNTASGGLATVGGGSGSTASGEYATVAGGAGDSATGTAATVGGGFENTASGENATVGGGEGNTASGYDATVSGGDANVAAGNFSFAGGNGAKAPFQGDFVWADDFGGSFTATETNQFAVRAAGGVLLAADVQIDSAAYHHVSLTGGNALGYLYGSYPKFGDGIHLGYNYYADGGGNDHISNTGGGTSRLTAGYGFVEIDVGGVNAVPTTQRLVANATGVSVFGTFNNSSDRNVKQDFAPVSPAQILDRVARLPISEWSYKTDVGTRHIGPMGQDFYSIFNIGTDEKHIAPVDEGGVALAAIQGLNEKVEVGGEKAEVRSQKSEARIQKLEAENAELKARLEKLEKLTGEGR